LFRQILHQCAIFGSNWRLKWRSAPHPVDTLI
jgi:hypothetical protein